MGVKTYPLPQTQYRGPISKIGGGMNPLGILSTIAGGIFGGHSARQQNRAAMAMAQKQMDFQERMSSTAYQRAALDLEKAGLNRVLALGNAASSPGGAAAPVANVGAAAVNAALSVARQKAEIKNIEANTAKTQEETVNVAEQRGNIFQQWRKFEEEIANLKRTGQLTDVQRQVQEKIRTIRGHEGTIIKSEADLWESLQNLNYDEAGQLTRLLGPTGVKLLQIFLMGRK